MAKTVGTAPRPGLSARQPEWKLVRPIVLIGLMGAGKSSVGLRLADLLGVPFRDSDHEIVEAAGMEIADIFESFGEAHFRDGERRVIARMLTDDPMVLAIGGGGFMNAQTRETIAAGATSVWLKAELDVLVYRTAGRTHRPLLNKGDPREILAGLIDARYPVYSRADVHVESERDVTHEAMAARIVEGLLAFQEESQVAVLEASA